MVVHERNEASVVAEMIPEMPPRRRYGDETNFRRCPYKSDLVTSRYRQRRYVVLPSALLPLGAPGAANDLLNRVKKKGVDIY